jgi:hypothetical protein
LVRRRFFFCASCARPHPHALLTECACEWCSAAATCCGWRLCLPLGRLVRRRSGRQPTASSCAWRSQRHGVCYAALLRSVALRRAAPPRRPSARWTAGKCLLGAHALLACALRPGLTRRFDDSCVIVRDGVVVASGSNSPNVTRNVRRRRCVASRAARRESCLLLRHRAHRLTALCDTQATRHAELEAIDELLAAHGGDAAAAGFDRCAARTKSPSHAATYAC